MRCVCQAGQRLQSRQMTTDLTVLVGLFWLLSVFPGRKWSGFFGGGRSSRGYVSAIVACVLAWRACVACVRAVIFYGIRGYKRDGVAGVGCSRVVQTFLGDPMICRKRWVQRNTHFARRLMQNFLGAPYDL